MAYGLETLISHYILSNKLTSSSKKVISDNGTTFIGEIENWEGSLTNMIEKQSNINFQKKNMVVLQSTFGSKYETKTKSAKQVKDEILGGAGITDEELATAFTDDKDLVNLIFLTY